MTTAVKCKRYKHRNTAAGILFLVLMVLAAAVILCVIMFCKIETIEVTGSELYAAEDIKTVSGVELGENIFTLDTRLAAEKVAAQFPYLRTVQVKRRLPNTVEIALTEEIARYAVVYDADRYTLLSESGRVLEQVYGRPTQGLFPLYGADFSAYAEGDRLQGEDADALETVSATVSAMEGCSFEKATYLDVTDKLCLYMLYDGRVLVKLGTELDMEYKLKLISEVLENQLPADFTGTLDVTISGKAYSKRCDLSELCNSVYLLQSMIQY